VFELRILSGRSRLARMLYAWAISITGVRMTTEKRKSRISRIQVLSRLKFSSTPIVFQIMSD